MYFQRNRQARGGFTVLHGPGQALPIKSTPLKAIVECCNGSYGEEIKEKLVTAPLEAGLVGSRAASVGGTACVCRPALGTGALRERRPPLLLPSPV